MIFCCRVTNKIKKKTKKYVQIKKDRFRLSIELHYLSNFTIGTKKKVQILSLNCDMSLNKDLKGKHCKIKK